MARCDHFDDEMTDYDYSCKDEREWEEGEEVCDFEGIVEASRCINSAWYLECPKCGRDKQYENL